MNELITKESLFVRSENGQMVLSSDAIESIIDIETEKRRIDKQYKKYRDALLAGMEYYGLTKFESDELLVSYVEPTERISVDQKKLYSEYPSVAFACEKESPVKSSVRVTVRR